MPPQILKTLKINIEQFYLVFNYCESNFRQSMECINKIMNVSDEERRNDFKLCLEYKKKNEQIKDDDLLYHTSLRHVKSIRSKYGGLETDFVAALPKSMKHNENVLLFICDKNKLSLTNIEQQIFEELLLYCLNATVSCGGFMQYRLDDEKRPVDTFWFDSDIYSQFINQVSTVTEPETEQEQEADTVTQVQTENFVDIVGTGDDDIAQNSDVTSEYVLQEKSDINGGINVEEEKAKEPMRNQDNLNDKSINVNQTMDVVDTNKMQIDFERQFALLNEKESELEQFQQSQFEKEKQLNQKENDLAEWESTLELREQKIEKQENKIKKQSKIIKQIKQQMTTMSQRMQTSNSNRPWVPKV